MASVIDVALALRGGARIVRRMRRCYDRDTVVRDMAHVVRTAMRRCMEQGVVPAQPELFEQALLMWWRRLQQGGPGPMIADATLRRRTGVVMARIAKALLTGRVNESYLLRFMEQRVSGEGG